MALAGYVPENSSYGHERKPDVDIIDRSRGDLVFVSDNAGEHDPQDGD